MIGNVGSDNLSFLETHVLSDDTTLFNIIMMSTNILPSKVKLLRQLFRTDRCKTVFLLFYCCHCSSALLFQPKVLFVFFIAK